MTSGFVLIAAILILGGVIATAGDRIGMRVGKARLSLFNLRPRQTATLITILTGGIISASTLGLLFAISEQLRTGVFELGEIQDELNTANSDLNQTRRNLRQSRRQQSRVERELSQAQAQRQAAQDRLRGINRSLQNAIQQRSQIEQQLKATQSSLQQTQGNFEQAQDQLQQTQQNFQQAQAQLRQVANQSTELQNDVAQLQQERDALVARQRQRETLIAELDQDLARREEQLRSVARQQQVLERQRNALVQEIQALREGDVALFNNQLLTAGVLQVDSAAAAQQAIDQILRQANQRVLQTVLPSVDPLETQVIKVRSAEVEAVIDRVSDNAPYVIQVASGGNYLTGEPCVISGQACVQVSLSAVPNELVFRAGEPITAVSLDPDETSEPQLLERLQLLISASQLRARQAGVLTRNVEISGGDYDDLQDFLRDLQERQQAQSEAVVVQAVSAADIYTIGPLALEFILVEEPTLARQE